jgi:hypothetical protein
MTQLVRFSFLIISCLSVVPAFAGPMIVCDVKSEPISAQLTIDSLGTTELTLRDQQSKVTYRCPLIIEEFKNSLGGVDATYKFEFYRDQDCSPSLPANLENGLYKEIALRVYPKESQRYDARLFLYELHEASRCHIQKVSEIDLKIFDKRFKPKMRAQSASAGKTHKPSQLPLKDPSDPGFAPSSISPQSKPE